MDHVIVRPANLSDLDALLAFEQAIIESERPFDATIRNGDDVHYYDLAALVSSPDAEVVVAERGGEIIGSGYARIDISKSYLVHAKHSYLGFMYVVPHHRGKGVNKKIVAALEAWSLSRGVTELQLEVYVENAAAIKAYEKSGYDGLILRMRKGDLKPKPITDSDPAFTAKTRDLLVAVLEGKADLTQFTPEVQKAITDQQDRLAAFVKTLGTIQGFKLVDRAEEAGGVRYRYQVEYAGMNLFLGMVVNKDGKISGFALQPE